MKWISNQNSITRKIITFVGLISSFYLSSCAPSNNTSAQTWMDNPEASAQVIYGTDGRSDLYQITDPNLKSWADSTVALIKNSDLRISGSSTLIQGENFGTQMNLCTTEKFREQDTAAFCSGSLVGEDLILTAGHCIQNQSDCQSTALVFGFAVKSAGVLPQSVNNNEVYHCQEVIRTQMATNGADFALIRLDRKVQGHNILPLHRSGEVDTNASLVVIGHPVGLPTKITTGGSVRSLAGAGFFQANLDTYGGNSGSAVFNAATGMIEGVLVRGEQDFVSSGRCSVSKVCAEGSCRGEDVTRISQVIPYIPTRITPEPPTPPQPPQKPRVFSSSTVMKIPDNNKTGINSQIAVLELPEQTPVIVHVKIQHSFIGDLVIKLIAPNGKSIMLQQRAGGSAHDLSQNYDVTVPLDFTAHPQTGSYTLSVQDLAARDVGSLLSWSIQFGL